MGRNNRRLNVVYHGMKQRCYNPHSKSYEYYGGRGIGVCAEWKNSYSAFMKWAYENGYDEKAPTGKCTLDRIDNSKDYSPDNCRFVDMKVQLDNRRVPQDGLHAWAHQKENTAGWEINGVKKSKKEWCREFKINFSTVQARLKKGISPLEALTTPIRKKNI